MTHDVTNIALNNYAYMTNQKPPCTKVIMAARRSSSDFAVVVVGGGVGGRKIPPPPPPPFDVNNGHCWFVIQIQDLVVKLAKRSGGQS
jgi:hypothetical protein